MYLVKTRNEPSKHREYVVYHSLQYTLFFWIPRCHIRTPTPKAAKPAMFNKRVLLSTGLLKLIGTSVATSSVGVEFVGMVIVER